MPPEVGALAERAIAERVFPGCVIGSVRADGTRFIAPLGNTQYEGGAPVTVETVYDVASITKSIPTASLALMQMSDGMYAQGDKVADFIPELHNHHDATIVDLLRYRVHGPRMATLPFRTFEEIRTHVFEHGFDGPPGESVYTNLPAYVLGVVVERVGGASLPVLAHRHFFDPLDMENTTFFPAPSICAPTEIDTRGEVRGFPHDESAYVFARARRAAGHAGLFSTANDLLIFLGVLLHGEFPAVAGGAQNGLGWQVNDPHFMGTFAGSKTFGKTGFTGTSIVCDLERDVAFVILSNRTYPERPRDTAAIDGFRRSIADLFLHNA